MRGAQNLDRQSDGEPQRSEAGTQAAPVSERSQSGSITGAVIFRGAPPPPRLLAQPLTDPACALLGAGPLAVHEGHVANAYVYLKGVPATFGYGGQPPVSPGKRGCGADAGASAYFAVSGPDGRYDLRGVPAGNYTLAVRAGALGEQEIRTTVLPRATGIVNVFFGK